MLHRRRFAVQDSVWRSRTSESGLERHTESCTANRLRCSIGCGTAIATVRVVRKGDRRLGEEHDRAARAAHVLLAKPATEREIQARLVELRRAHQRLSLSLLRVDRTDKHQAFRLCFALAVVRISEGHLRAVTEFLEHANDEVQIRPLLLLWPKQSLGVSLCSSESRFRGVPLVNLVTEDAQVD